MGSVPSRGFGESMALTRGRMLVRAFSLPSFWQTQQFLIFADVFLFLFEHKAVAFFFFFKRSQPGKGNVPCNNEQLSIRDL